MVHLTCPPRTDPHLGGRSIFRNPKAKLVGSSTFDILQTRHQRCEYTPGVGLAAPGNSDRLAAEMPTRQSVRKTASMLVLACISAGCTTVSVTATRSEVQARDPQPSTHHIRLIDDEVPDRPHKVIGTVRAKVKLSPYLTNVWPEDKIVKRLKTEARKIGGDALINLTTTPVRGGGVYLDPTSGFGQVNTQLWTASVIVWLD